MTAPGVRRGLRRAGLVVLVLLVPVAAWSAWDYVEARRLSNFVRQLRVRGEPVRSAAASRPHVYPPPTHTAGPYYEAAALVVDRAGLSEIESALYHQRGARRAQIERLRTWLEQNKVAEWLLDAASNAEFKGFRSLPDSLRMDRMNTAASLARARVLERLDTGDAEGAALALFRQLRVVRTMAPTEYDWMPYAIDRALTELGPVLTAAPPDDVLHRLQQTIREYDRDTLIQEDMANARATLIESLWQVSSDWYGPPAVRYSSNPLEPLAYLAARPWLAHRVNGALRRIDAAAAAARAPWPERLKVPAVAMPRISANRWRLLDSPATTIEYLQYARVEMFAAMLANLRTANAAIAVERYRRAHGGALPPSFDALVPAFLAAVPVDPFSGAAIRFAARPAGYVVYSVGLDGKDDGGVVALKTPPKGGMRDRLRAVPDIGTQVTMQKESVQ